MDQLKNLWNKIDPKLKYTVLTTIVVRALAALAIPLDPVLESVIALAIGSVVGYQVTNDGTQLRALPVQSTGRDSGGLPPELAERASAEGNAPVIMDDDLAPSEPDLPVLAAVD